MTHNPVRSASAPYKQRREEEDDDNEEEAEPPTPLDVAATGDTGAMAHNSLMSSVMCTIIFRSFKNHTNDGLRQLAENDRITSLAAEAICIPLRG